MRVLLAASAMVLANAAAAQTVDEVVVTGDRVQPMALDAPAQSASRLAIPLLDTPAAVEVLDQATLQARGRTTVTQALQGATGVIGFERAGAPGVYSWRGFTENAVATLYDGIRVQGSTITARQYDAFLFDRIEVARGPGSGLHGEGALAGAVNYVRRKPAMASAPTYEYLVAAGSGDAWRAALDANLPLGERAALRLDGAWSASDGRAAGNRTEVRNVSAQGLVALTDELTTTLTLDYLDNAVDDAYWGTPLIDGRIPFELAGVNYNNATDNLYRDQVLWAIWGLEWRPTEALTVQNRLYRYEAERDWRNIGRFLWNAATGTVGRTFWEDLAYDHRMTGDRLTAVFDGERFDWSLGAEVAATDFASPRQYSAPFGLQQQVDPRHPPPVDFFAFGRPRVRAVETRLDQAAVFGEARAQLTGRLALQGSLRFDRLDVDFVRYDQTPIGRFEGDYDATTGTLGAVFKLADQVRLYVQAGTSATPADSLLVISNPVTAGFGFTKGEGYEAGFKGRFLDGRLEATGAVFKLTQRDILSNDPANPALTRQIGEIESQGIELTAVWLATERLRLEGNLAVTDAEFAEFREGTADRAGNRPPNVPELVANLFAEYALTDTLSIGGSVRHVGDIAANTSNSVVFPDYTVLDLDLSWTFAPGVEATLFAQNLTDENYAIWATAAGGQAAMANIAPGRRFVVQLRGRF